MLLSTPFPTITATATGAGAGVGAGRLLEAQVFPQATQAPLMEKRNSVPGWTSLGPVTSLWTPPASCYLTTTSYEGSLYIYDHFTGSAISSISCNPPIPWMPIVTGSAVEFFGPETWTSRYYSPAICPSGWSTASDLSPSWQTVAGDDANTAFLCCPSGYNAPTNTLEPCTSYLSSGATLSNVWARPTEPAHVSMGSSPVLTPQVLSTSQRIDAMPLVVLWQTTDTQILQLLTSISSVAAGAQPTSGSSTKSSQPYQLSNATKGGIAVGIVIVFFAIVLGIFCAFRRRGKRESSDSEADPRPRPKPRPKPRSRPQSRPQSRPRPKTQELIKSSNKREPTKKHNSPKVIFEEEKKHTSIPQFPMPPTMHDFSIKHQTRDLDVEKHIPEDDYGYSAVPMRSPGLGGPQMHFNTNIDTLSQGEQLTPTTYVPPGRTFSRESTARGSPDNSFGRDSATLGSESSLYPAPLELRASPSNSDMRERSSPIPTGSRERLEQLQDRIERIREEKERLERIQELRELEEQTKREIMEEEERRAR